MQQETFTLTLTLQKRSLKKNFDGISQVLPKNTIGSYMSHKIGNLKRIKLVVPSLKFSTAFNVVEDHEQISQVLSFYNLVCSLQTCGINFKLSDVNSELERLTILFIAENAEVAQFLKSTSEKLSKII